MLSKTDNDNQTSSFLVDSFEGISNEFADIQELSARGYSLLLRAKRYGRWYVLKTLSEDTVRQSVYMQVLRKELEVLMLMQHPNVVQAIGMEQVSGIGPCIVMEYIDGQTLQQLMDKDSLPSLQERRHMADELCSAVGYIHSLGIVHRDLKPENIMVTRNGNRIKVIDFGMADTDQHAVLKQPAGTLNYMAPEQAEQSTPDIRNDIYSLGLILKDLQLGSKYNKVIAHCLKPINQRYANIDELQDDIRRLQTRYSRLKVAAAVSLITILLVFSSVLGWRLHAIDNYRQSVETDIDSMRRQIVKQQKFINLNRQQSREAQQAEQRLTNNRIDRLNDSISKLTSDNQRLTNELQRLERGQREALTMLRREMKLSAVDRHLDTLSRWADHWPDLSNRIADVSRFIYRYIDQLPPSYSLSEREQIRTSMLNEWQLWSQRVKTRANSIRKRQVGPLPDSLRRQRNMPPKDLL